MHDFKVELAGTTSEGVIWLQVKERYQVRFPLNGPASCDCKGQTFKMSGRNQSNCKHIIAARRFLELAGYNKAELAKLFEKNEEKK